MPPGSRAGPSSCAPRPGAGGEARRWAKGHPATAGPTRGTRRFGHLPAVGEGTGPTKGTPQPRSAQRRGRGPLPGARAGPRGGGRVGPEKHGHVRAPTPAPWKPARGSPGAARPRRPSGPGRAEGRAPGGRARRRAVLPAVRGARSRSAAAAQTAGAHSSRSAGPRAMPRAVGAGRGAGAARGAGSHHPCRPRDRGLAPGPFGGPSLPRNSRSPPLRRGARLRDAARESGRRDEREGRTAARRRQGPGSPAPMGRARPGRRPLPDGRAAAGVARGKLGARTRGAARPGTRPALPPSGLRLGAPGRTHLQGREPRDLVRTTLPASSPRQRREPRPGSGARGPAQRGRGDRNVRGHEGAAAPRVLRVPPGSSHAAGWGAGSAPRERHAL